MFIQIFVGSCLILLSVLVATLGFLVFEIILNRAHTWLIKEPTGPNWRLLSGICATNGLLNIGMMTALLMEVLRNQLDALHPTKLHKP